MGQKQSKTDTLTVKCYKCKTLFIIKYEDKKIKIKGKDIAKIVYVLIKNVKKSLIDIKNIVTNVGICKIVYVNARIVI